MREKRGEPRKPSNVVWVAATVLLSTSILAACVSGSDKPEITPRLAEVIDEESGMEPHCNCKVCEFIRDREASK